MVSMACYQDHHHMAIDPLPTGPSSTPPDVSSIRCVFQGVARTNKQAAPPAATSRRNTTHQALRSSMALPEAPGSMENSESSISSCFQLSSNSDDDDDASSSSTSSTLSPDAAASPQHEGPLLNLASLCAALPVKRGLSRYFSGKSQSFSSLAHVSSVADLAKPENPYVKRRRTTAGDSLLKHESYPPRCASSAGSSKRHANNQYKGLISFPVCEVADLEGRAKPYPIKCFSLPELQETQ